MAGVESVALSWSGGKDSALALWTLRKSGVEPVALLTTVTAGYDRVSIHGVRRRLLTAQTAATGIPLVAVSIPPACSNTIYEQRVAAALADPRLARVESFAFGDLYLEDIRAYRERQFAEAGKRTLFPLWHNDTATLARRCLPPPHRVGSVRHGRRVVAARAHPHLHRPCNRHAPRRTTRPPLARRPPPRQPPARPPNHRPRPHHHPKSRAGTRTIHLGPRTTALLAKHYEHSRYHTDPNLVFSHPHLGTPLDPNRLATAYLRPALHAAGITKPFRPYHDLRHTSLTHEAAAGNPHTYIQAKAGHSTSTTTERYIHAAQTAFPGAPHRYEVRLFPP